MTTRDDATDDAGEPRSGTNWFRSNLVAIGSAAVLAVYSAGFTKTRAAAQRFAQEDMARQRPAPAVIPQLEIADAPGAAPPSSNPPASSETKSDSGASKPSAAKTDSLRNSAAAVAVSESAAPSAAATKPAAARDSTNTGAAVTTAVAVNSNTKPDSVTQKTQPVDTVIPPPKPKWKDGIYKGYGTSRHGDIEAEVEIKGGRIVFAFISQCLTQYPCSVFDRVVPQVISRQSPEVDYVSGATQSVNAFYYAVIEALNKAK